MILRFLKSGVDLDEEIQRIKQVAASSELLSSFMKQGGLNAIIPLLQHANTDLAGSVLEALVELTFPDSLLELGDPTEFVNNVVRLIQ